MGLFDFFKNILKKEIDTKVEQSIEENPKIEQSIENVRKETSPLRSLLKDNTGFFPRREKENVEKNETLLCPHCGEEFSENQKMNYADHLRNHEFLKQGPIAAVPDFMKKQKIPEIKNVSPDVIQKIQADIEWLNEDIEGFQKKSALSIVLKVLKGKVPREEELLLKKQNSLQELSTKLTLQLSDFWGIPADITLAPKVNIIKQNALERLGLNVEIAATIPLGLKGYAILVNERYLSNEFQGELNIKSVLAEEVCHSLENHVKNIIGSKDISAKYVSEFFGMISRFYVTEQVPELFHENYREHLHLEQSVYFNKEKKDIDDLLAEIDETKKMLRHDIIERRIPTDSIEKALKRIEEQERDLRDEKIHLSYFPGAAYYFEIKKMTSQERYGLLRMNPEEIKKKVIEEKAEKILTEIGKTIQERNAIISSQLLPKNLRMGQVQGTASFFQKVEETTARERAVSEAIEYKQEERKFEEGAVTGATGELAKQGVNEIIKPGAQAGILKGLENVGQFFERAASEIGKAAYGRVTEAVTARHEQPEEPMLETGDVMEEYPQEEEYEEPAEEEYQESGEYENVPPPLPKVVINIPNKIPKDLAKKLESRGIKIPKNKIK